MILEDEPPKNLSAFDILTIENFSRQTLNKNLVFYNRVPKCASTSMEFLFKSLLENSPDTHRYKIVNNIESGMKHLLKDDKEIELFIRNTIPQTSPSNQILFIQHLYFIDFQKFNQKTPIYINLLRNPVDQWISGYYFLRFGFEKFDSNGNKINSTLEERQNWKKYNNVNFSDEEMQMDIETCIKSETKSCVNVWSELLSYFCGHEQPLCLRRDQAAFERAKYNLVNNFAAVGILENLKDSLLYFDQVVPNFFHGLKEEYNSIGSNFANSKTMNKKVEGRFVREYLAEKLKFEIMFYNFANELMYTRLRK